MDEENKGAETAEPIPAAEAVAPNKEPDKLFGRIPAFWQAIFAGATAFFGLCLLVNGVATSIMVNMQRRLTRQQVVGTQAAELAYQFTLYSPDNTLSVSFDHRGLVAAKDVRLAFRAVRKSIPSLEDIESPINKTIEVPVYSKDSFLHHQHDFSLPGLTPNEFEAMKRTEQTVKVEGEFSYDNGFGDVVRQTVCLYWLIGIQNVTEDKGAANGFYSCDGFDVRMNNVLKARQEVTTP